MTHLLTEVLPQILAQSSGSSSDSNNGVLVLLASGPAAGIAFFWMVFRYYRNTDKSHDFEHEPGIAAQPVQGADQKVDQVRGTTESSTRGRNEKHYRQRVQRVG